MGRHHCHRAKQGFQVLWEFYSTFVSSEDKKNKERKTPLFSFPDEVPRNRTVPEMTLLLWSNIIIGFLCDLYRKRSLQDGFYSTFHLTKHPGLRSFLPGPPCGCFKGASGEETQHTLFPKNRIGPKHPSHDSPHINSMWFSGPLS